MPARKIFKLYESYPTTLHSFLYPIIVFFLFLFLSQPHSPFGLIFSRFDLVHLAPMPCPNQHSRCRQPLKARPISSTLWNDYTNHCKLHLNCLPFLNVHTFAIIARSLMENSNISHHNYYLESSALDTLRWSEKFSIHYKYRAALTRSTCSARAGRTKSLSLLDN